MATLGKNQWAAAEHDYVYERIPYRKLAEKYGVNFTTISRYAKKHDWVAKANEHTKNLQSAYRNAESEAIDKATETISGIQDKYLDAMDKLIDQICATLELPLKPMDLRAVALALRDYTDLKQIRNPLDIEEQRARIAKLKKEAEAEVVTGDYGIVLLPPVREVSADE